MRKGLSNYVHLKIEIFSLALSHSLSLTYTLTHTHTHTKHIHASIHTYMQSVPDRYFDFLVISKTY